MKHLHRWTFGRISASSWHKLDSLHLLLFYCLDTSHRCFLYRRTSLGHNTNRSDTMVMCHARMGRFETRRAVQGLYHLPHFQEFGWILLPTLRFSVSWSRPAKQAFIHWWVHFSLSTLVPLSLSLFARTHPLSLIHPSHPSIHPAHSMCYLFLHSFWICPSSCDADIAISLLGQNLHF